MSCLKKDTFVFSIRGLKSDRFFSPNSAVKKNRKEFRKPEVVMSSISTIRFTLFDCVRLVFEANVQ